MKIDAKTCSKIEISAPNFATLLFSLQNERSLQGIFEKFDVYSKATSHPIKIASLS